MEDLNKTQLVLLTLLVSFVTSIATGIITSSLLQIAPTTVTQTIDRVVQQTIEQAAPTVTAPGDNTPAPVKETTVVVQEEDQVLGAISKTTPSIVRIVDNTINPQTSTFYSIGIVLTKGGLIIAPVRAAFSAGDGYSATLSDGSAVTLQYLGTESGNRFLFFKVIPAGTPFKGVAASLASSYAQLGQTVVNIEGETKNIVTVARVSEISNDPSDANTEDGVGLDTPPKSDALGAPIVDLTGNIIGIRSSDTAASGTPIYISPVFLSDAISDYEKK